MDAGLAGDQDFEIVIYEELPIGNYDQLPEPVTETPEAEPVPEGDAEPVTGGTAFADAPEIGAGSWTDESRLGETRLYAVGLEPGQRLVATVRTPVEGEPPISGPRRCRCRAGSSVPTGPS